MTDLRKAAEIAISALQSHGAHHPSVYSAISSLRAALALQPRREPGWNGLMIADEPALAARCECGDRAATACPGAWEKGCDLGANEAHVAVAAWAWQLPDGPLTALMSEPPAETPDGVSLVRLYTHPQRPLTEEEIKALPNTDGEGSDWDALVRFARLIEKAHGITAQGDSCSS